MTRVIPGNLKSLSITHTDLPSIDNNQSSPILIVGMHNSGTSILAEIIHKSGIFLGSNMEHYESHFFSIYLNDLLIMGGEYNWANLPLLSVDQVMSFKETVGPFIKKYWIIDYLQWGYDNVSPWGIKDPRLCVLLPLYLAIFPDAKVVHIRRNPNDVAASLSQKSKRGIGKLDNFEHWRELTLAYTNRVIEYSAQASAYHELAYEEFCNNTEEIIQSLFEFLDLPYTKKTEQLLSKVSSSRIGSYERYKNPRPNIIKNLSNWIGKK
ncbi:MAG: sulfotransferase [Microcystaceae cyanobacterium]